MKQNHLDRCNIDFWNELCGSVVARSLGITNNTPENLARFDEAYLAFYPYLKKYLDAGSLRGKRVLEIGLGYGSLGQLLVQTGCEYYGVDIAENSAALMQQRLKTVGKDPMHVQIGSALDVCYRDETFDYVYSIGCLHHAGELSRAVAEVHRVLKPSGKAIVMLYNRHAFRRWFMIPMKYCCLRVHNWFSGRRSVAFSEYDRAFYDATVGGEAAPHTDFVSKRDVKDLFRGFSSLQLECQNFDSISVMGLTVIPRQRLLNNIGRIAGLDLYVIATK